MDVVCHLPGPQESPRGWTAAAVVAACGVIHCEAQDHEAPWTPSWVCLYPRDLFTVSCSHPMKLKQQNQ